MNSLEEKLRYRSAVVGVMGLGYVGLPLALSFAGSGFAVIGFDKNPQVVADLARGLSHLPDVPASLVQRHIESGALRVTTDFEQLAAVDAVCICVPTPLSKTKDPDLSYIVAALDDIKRFVGRDCLVVLESTTFPGTTNELVLPALESTGRQVGHDIFLCFSPERIDPGNKQYGLSNTPKVVGGVTPACTELGVLLYQAVSETVVPVSSARTAEMVKLLENTFRAVNIALVNELSLMCERMGLDVWEVVAAARTKPFGFMSFLPGPGIGGHCIPLDPMYLSWKARAFNFHARFIDLASDINGNMPYHVVQRVGDALNLDGKPLLHARVLCLGVAYKPNVNDARESPAVEIMRLLRQKGASVAFHDPLVTAVELDPETVLNSVELTAPQLAWCDCIVLCTDHDWYDYEWIAQHSPLVVDTRNAFAGVSGGHIVRTGTPLGDTPK